MAVDKVRRNGLGPHRDSIVPHALGAQGEEDHRSAGGRDDRRDQARKVEEGRQTRRGAKSSGSGVGETGVGGL